MARRANKGGLRPPRGLGGAEPPWSEWNAAKRVAGAATERRRELARCRAPPERRSGAMTPHAGTAQTFLRGASARRERRGRDCGRCRRAVLRGGLRAEAIEVAAGRADGAGLAGGGRRDVGPTRRRQTRVGSLPLIRECRRHRAGCFSVGGVCTPSWTSAGAKTPPACGERECFTLKAIGMAAGRAGGQNGLGPRNGGLKRVARWYATKENRTGRVVRFPRDE